MYFNAFHDFILSYLPVLFYVMFYIVIGMFILIGFKFFRQWSINNASPKLAVPVVVMEKYENTWYQNGKSHSRAHAYISFHVIFQMKRGDPMELQLPKKEYDLLVKGDLGILHFQGTRYLWFEGKDIT